ncbi:MAG: HD domain-containing protein [Gammaproteobacteria bacterium]|nr:HD domain-containing protein [Gammaproteobacteria bacterium]
MPPYEDKLKQITREELITNKLKLVYQEIKLKFNFIDRISLALYDAECDTLTTYIHCTSNGDPLSLYQSRLSDSKSLQEIAKTGDPRIVNDMSVFDSVKKRHSDRIKKYGFKSSYTYPIYNKNQFYGFIFINSTQLNAFTDDVLEQITPLIHLIAAFTVIEFSIINTLTSTVKTALVMSHHRDPETGEHLDRMARYSRLIAMGVARQYNLNDETIEHIYLFAPLHDVGKIAIPDKILLKPGKLTFEEFELMKTHTSKGLEIINTILDNYQLDGMQHTAILRSIILSHHEKMNGKGYPDGLVANEIPIAARIIAVADVFDALTSKRPYKEAWSNDEAFAELKRISNDELDADCVDALLKNRKVIERIQSLFVDSE